MTWSQDRKVLKTKHPEIAQISDLGNKAFQADIINMSKTVKEAMVSVIRQGISVETILK